VLIHAAYTIKRQQTGFSSRSIEHSVGGDVLTFAA
jgi:hypothetical protein